MVIFLSLLGIFVWFLYHYATRSFDHWRKRKMPGPKPFPFVGTYPKSAILRQHIMYEQQALYEKYKHQHRVIGVYERGEPWLLVLDPQLLNDIYVKHFNQFPMNDSADAYDEALDPIFCRNLFTAEHKKWQIDRNAFSPAFTPAKIRPMYPRIAKSSREMAAYIANKAKKMKPITILAKDMTSRYTLDVCLSCIYGLEGNAFNEISDHVDVVRWFSPTILHSTVNAILGTLPVLRHIYDLPFFPYALSEWFFKTFDTAVAYRQQSNQKPNDFLTYILSQQSSNGYSNKDLAGYASMFFLDAYETVSMMLAQTLYFLADNVACQNKLRNEIHSFLPSMDSNILEKLPYMDNVINETIRISPSAFLFTKICMESMQYTDYDGTVFTIEEGTHLQMPTHAIHHDEQYFEQPDVFNPDRFDVVSAKALKKNGQFLPFGNGPRICLGRKFGVSTIKVALVHLITSYSISVNPKTTQPIEASPLDSQLTTVSDIYLDFTPLSGVPDMPTFDS